MRTIFNADLFAASPFAEAPVLGLVSPALALRRPVLGQQREIDPDDARALRGMDVEDLVTLGRVVSCGKIIATNEIVNTLVALVRSVSRAFELLGLAVPGDLPQALKDAQVAEKNRQLVTKSDTNAMLSAIADAIMAKQPDWEVSYYDWNGDVVVKSSKGEIRRRVSLGAPAPTFEGALKFVDDNSGILDRMQAASRLSGLGNPGWQLFVLGIILILAAAAVAIIYVVYKQKERWLGELSKQMVQKRIENDRDQTRIKEIESKGEKASASELEEKKRLQGDVKRREAEIGEAEKTAKSLREIGGVITEVIRALGIAPIVQGVLIGAGVILLTGLAIWVFSKEPKPASTALIKA